MKLTKMHGLGNDYVYVDTQIEPEPSFGWSELAKRISDRRFGVGGDGLILIEKGQSEGAHGRMRMFNADGSESEMCGNGLRCVGKYLHDHRYPNEAELKIDTGAGLLKVSIVEKSKEGKALELKVNMGQAILEAKKIPTKGLGAGLAEKITVAGREFEYTAISMGNPHCVIFVEDVDHFELEKYGPLIENNLEVFPNRVNVEFVEIKGRGEAKQRTWERGSGETFACGTGACAVAVAGQLRGHFDSEVLIHLKGGDLRLSRAGEGAEVMMTGPATFVFEGEVDLEELMRV